MQNTYRSNTMNYSRNRQRSTAYHQTDSCCNTDDVLEGMSLAMAYVPWQNWHDIYDAAKGLQRGTIFEELDMPFLGKGGARK